MAQYTSVPQAIQLCRETYQGLTYTVKEENTGEILVGSAYDVYSRMLMDELKARFSAAWWPVAENDDVQCALLETIYAILGHAPRYWWEREALDLLNHIVAEVEDR